MTTVTKLRKVGHTTRPTQGGNALMMLETRGVQNDDEVAVYTMVPWVVVSIGRAKVMSRSVKRAVPEAPN